ncbi:MAG: SDR family NAD(P)-dependent oxidoreductase [Candidatus Kariarchaeaceae archaeon]
MNRLKDKIAIVTGVANKASIGYGIAKKLAQEGATVQIIDIQSHVLKRAKNLLELGVKADGYIADLTIESEVLEIINKIKMKYRRLDILVNCAGKSIPPRPSFNEMTESYFDKVMNRNLKTAFQCCKAVIPTMIEQEYGKIVNISSTTGPLVVYRFSSAYAASKGALSSLTRALALELGEHNINVNAVLPGIIHTEGTPWTSENDPYNFKNTHPAVKWPIHGPGFPEDIANTVVFLATDDSRYITGQEIVVDGGAGLVEPIPSPNDHYLYENAPKE